MTRLPLLVSLLLIIPLVPNVVADDGGPDRGAEDALDTALALFRNAQTEGSETARRQAADYLRDHVVSHSEVPADDVMAAWDARLEAASTDASAPYAAEALLLRLVRDNVIDALARDDDATADLWMRLAHSRVDRSGWSIPSWDVERGLHDQNVTKDVDAIIAARARETLVEALLIHRGGAAAEAEAVLEGATAFLAILVDHAAGRLPDALQTTFIDQATRGTGLLADVPGTRSDDTWPGLMAPLVALELDRDMEQLDTFAMRNVDASAMVARAARERPETMPFFAEQAWLQYGADRPGLYLRGEGLMNETDTAYDALQAAAANGDPQRIDEAAGEVRTALTGVGLLVRGIVLKVETGGVRPDRVHEYQVTLVRPPLDGIAHYAFEITYDPEVLTIVGAEPFGPHDHPNGVDGPHEHEIPGWDVRFEDGLSVFKITPDEPVRRSAHILTLYLEARGAQGSETGLTLGGPRLLEPDGDVAELHLMRDGHVTITVMPDAQQATAESASPGFLWVVAILAAVAVGRRGRGA